MTSRYAEKLISGTTAVYRRLLYLYPLRFRRDYQQPMEDLLADLCRDSVKQRGLAGLILVWRRTLWDTAVAVPGEYLDEWRHTMQRNERLALAIGSLFLLYSFSFAAVNILIYNLGFANLWNPFDLILYGTLPALISQTLDLLIIVGPAVALLCFALPLVRIRLDRGDGVLLATTVELRQGFRLNLILIGACLLVGAVFTVYVVAENLPCLLGQQLGC